MSRIQQEVSECPQQHTKSMEVDFGTRHFTIIMISEYLGGSVPQPTTLSVIFGGFASQCDSVG